MLPLGLRNPVNAENFCRHIKQWFQGTMKAAETTYSSTTTTWLLRSSSPLLKQAFTESIQKFAELCRCQCTMDWETDTWILSLPLGVTVAEVVVKIESDNCAQIVLAIVDVQA